MVEHKFVAKRESYNYVCYYVVNGLKFEIGKFIANSLTMYVFYSSDEELADAVNSLQKLHMTITDRFVALRDVYVALATQRKAESEAEFQAENAWLRVAENFDEHRIEMEWQDAAGYT